MLFPGIAYSTNTPTAILISFPQARASASSSLLRHDQQNENEMKRIESNSNRNSHPNPTKYVCIVFVVYVCVCVSQKRFDGVCKKLASAQYLFTEMRAIKMLAIKTRAIRKVNYRSIWKNLLRFEWKRQVIRDFKYAVVIAFRE